MDRAQGREKRGSGIAHIYGMFAVDAIAIDGLENRFPSFRLDLLARTGAAIVIRGHLSQNSIAEAERGIAEPFKAKAIEELAIHDGSCYDDFRTPRPNSFYLPALSYRKTRETLSNPTHLGPRDEHALPVSSAAQMACHGRQGSGSTGSGNDISHPRGTNPGRDSIDLACDKAVQPLQFTFAWRIMTEKFVGETDGTERKTHGIANVSAVRNGQLAASATKVHHEGGNPVDARTRGQTQMNESRLFQARDDFYFPSGGRSDPLEKCLGISRIPQRTGGHHPDVIGDDLLCGAVKTAQDFHRLRHRFGSQESGAKDAFAEPSNLAVLMQGAQAADMQPRDL